jgi:hypothetical protein
MAYIYKHIRLDTNDIFYIGIGKLKNRLLSHYNRNAHWKCIVNKCGYVAEVIEDDLSWEEACEKEIYWIKYYGRADLKEGNLVNMTDGGEGNNNIIFTNETKKILSQKNIGKIHSTETKKLMSLSKIGKSHTNETKQKIKNKLKGRIGNRLGSILSEETKQKMSASHIGKPKSIETIQKMKLAKQNMSNETKHKISLAKSGKMLSELNPASVKCIDLETNIVYNSIRDASIKLNISYKKLHYMINNSKKNKKFKKL